MSEATIDEDRVAALDDAGLSPQQARVQVLIEQGLTHREIADRLSLKRGTVNSHVDRIRQKADRSRTLLALLDD